MPAYPLRFVLVKPGETALTLIPSGASSIAMATVKALRAVLGTQGRRGRRSSARGEGRVRVRRWASQHRSTTVERCARSAFRAGSGSICLVDSSEDAEHVGVPHRAHFIEGHVARAGRGCVLRDGLAGKLTRIRDRRVLDEHVEAAELGPNPLRRGGDRSRVCHIELERVGVRADSPGGGLAELQIAMDLTSAQ